MPEQTREFSRYWRTPGWEPELTEQNATLKQVLLAAQKDVPTATHLVADIQAMLEDGWGGDFGVLGADPGVAGMAQGNNVRYQLMYANMILRMQLVQTLATFEAVNELATQLGLQHHPFTLTPNAIRDALEMHPSEAPLDRILGDNV